MSFGSPPLAALSDCWSPDLSLAERLMPLASSVEASVCAVPLMATACGVPNSTVVSSGRVTGVAASASARVAAREMTRDPALPCAASGRTTA